MCIQYRKLVDNFSHESDVASLQDPFMSRPYKTPFYFYYCVPRNIRRGILFQIHVEYSPSSRLLVSALTVYATTFRPMFPFSSISLLSDYMCVRLQFILCSIASLTWRTSCVDLKPNQKKTTTFMCPCVITSRARGLLPSQHRRWSTVFGVLFQQTNKQTV